MGTQTTTQTSSLPPWLDSAYQDLLSRAGTASQQGYQPYVDASGNAIPRIAGFTPDQLSAFDAVRGSVGAANGDFSTASKLITDAGAARGYAAATPFLQAASSYTGLGAAQPYINQATGINGADAASPWVTQGMNTSSVGVANPLVQQGTGSWTNNASAYMSPYTQQVTDRIAQLGARNLSENLLPAVNKTFTGSGQFGSTRNSDFTNRAVRDTQDSILGQQAQALEAGYKTASDIYNQDASRQLQGGLGLGNLANSDANRQVQGGLGLGQLTDSYGNRVLNAGQLSGSLASGDLDRMARLADSAANITNQDASRSLQAGNALSALGTSRQNSALTGANALAGIGAQQQQLNQNSLDTMYGDFQNQQGWDKNNIAWLSSILSGSAKPTTTTTTSPGASTGSQILGGLTSGIGLLGATGAFGSNGWGGSALSSIGSGISSAANWASGLFAEGGRVKLARGGLARPGFAAGGAVDYTTMPDDILRQAANGGDIGALREVNRRQNPDRAGYRNLTGTRNQPYEPGYNQGAILPAIKDAANATFDELSKPVGERGGLAPPLADLRAEAPNLPFNDFSHFDGAYPTPDEIGGGLGLATPLPGRKPTPPTAQIIDLPRSDYSTSTADPYMSLTPEQQVRQDIEEEVGPSPGPTPMGGLGSPQPPTDNAPRGGLSAPADAGADGSDRWGGDSDIWNTLMATGAGMMASKSPSLLGGVGEGLASGLGAARASKDRDLKQQLLARQQGNDDTRLGLEKRRVDVAEQREKREAASDLLTLSGAGDKNQPAQAKMIKYLMDGGMSRDEATDRVFGAKTDPLERAKLVGNMAKIYAENGDDPDAALEKARKTVDMLAPPRTSNARGVSSNPGIKVGTQAKRGDGSIIVWNGKQWVAQ